MNTNSGAARTADLLQEESDVYCPQEWILGPCLGPGVVSLA